MEVLRSLTLLKVAKSQDKTQHYQLKNVVKQQTLELKILLPYTGNE